MRAVHLDHLQPGQYMGQTLRDEFGHVLLRQGVSLTREYIESLRSKGYVRLYVRDADSPGLADPDEDIHPETRVRALNTLRIATETITKEYPALRSASFGDVRKALDSGMAKEMMGPRGAFQGLGDAVARILEDVLSRPTLAGLTTIKTRDAALYEHSIDVCVVALMIGRACGMNNSRLRQLAAGCLLHDIGMLFLDASLPERIRLRQHALLGYELLRHTQDIDLLAPHVALEHHENQDGTGLPRGTRSSNTLERNRDLPPPIPSLIGEIAAVANCYDLLVSGIASNGPISPDEAILFIRRSSGTLFNREVVTAFLRVVPVYPVGSEVFIMSGQFRQCTGVVIVVNPNALDRPLIALYRDPAGRVMQPIKLDLAEETDIRIRARVG